MHASGNVQRAGAPGLCRNSSRDRFALQVPFALANGRLVHVSQVAGREDGPFVCPGCEAALVLRDGPKKRRHFGHAAGQGCSGGPESGLHLYAKDLLNRVRSIRIPPYMVEVGGRRRTAHPGGTYAFAAAEIEPRRDGFRPDLVLHNAGSSLVVEIKVRHAVDEEKRLKLDRAGTSAIEIDLAPLYRLDVALDELDQAILTTAGRHWLSNRRDAAHRKTVAAAIRREERDAAERFLATLRRRPAFVVSADEACEIEAAVAAAGFAGDVGLAVPGDHWFAAPAAVWQAMILKKLVIDRAALHLAQPLRLPEALTGDLPHGLVRGDLPARPSPRLLAGAGLSVDDYGSAHQAIWSYLAALSDRDGPVVLDARTRWFVVEPDAHGRIYRERELASTVSAILRDAVPECDAPLLLAAWRRTPLGPAGPSPDELVAAGGPEFAALARRLHALRRMAQPYGRSVTDDLCGLPLEALRERRLAEKAEADAKREAERLAAANGRRRCLTDLAATGLGDEAAAWLAAEVAENLSRADHAGASDQGLDAMLRDLSQAERARRARLAAERTAAAAKAELSSVAATRLPSVAHAELFLRSAHPRLRGARPLEYCRSRATLDHCLALLPAGRR